jgi:hypothetical protein
LRELVQIAIQPPVSSQFPTEAPRRRSSHHAAWKRARARKMLSHCSNVGGSGHVVAMTCESVRSSSRRCHPFVPERFEAALDGGRRHYGGDLRIKRDLLAASIQQTLGKIRESGLENDRVRNGGYGAIIRQAQPYDARDDCGTGTLRHDIANATFAQRSGPAKRLGQMLGVGRFR